MIWCWNWKQGGAPASDLKDAGSDAFLSLTSLGIKNLPAATVNSLPTSYLTIMSTNQLNAFTNSPHYSDFSSTVKSLLDSLSTGSYTSPSTTSSKSSLAKFDFVCMIWTILTAAVFFYWTILKSKWSIFKIEKIFKKKIR